MFIAEAITLPSDTSSWNTDATGWCSNATPTISPEPKTAVESDEYWAGIAKTVRATNPSEALLVNPLSSESLQHYDFLHRPDTNNQHHGLTEMAGSIFVSLARRSKFVTKVVTAVALIASHSVLPMASPQNAEASNLVVPIVKQPAGWTCVGEAQARQMDPLCEVGHGMFPCAPDSAYHIAENGNQIPASKFYSTSSLLGKERCEFTCESPQIVDKQGAGHTHQWMLTDVCFPVKQNEVTTPSTTHVTQPPTENYGTTQTAPPPTEYYGTVQTAGQVIDGQAQVTPPGGDGFCDALFTMYDPDCANFTFKFTLFGGGGDEVQQYQAPATENTAPPITEQVPNVPAPANTTDNTDWQTPTTTGNVGGGACSEQGLYCAKCVREQIPAIFLAERLKQIGLQCH